MINATCQIMWMPQNLTTKLFNGPLRLKKNKRKEGRKEVNVIGKQKIKLAKVGTLFLLFSFLNETSKLTAIYTIS